ncbi:hypothetical protein A9Q84_11910 [Halobacteriovorax marinus]|uniref:Metallo-beta-lactamase domain-containing protein n=1 Tax=Halobacteriovorax marinus TaxID=97084 RepID=A0A1Y5FC56_9BACT|nr:hypothetical protein A9Q84_11910 [Halobacteriovorax marinus]
MANLKNEITILGSGTSTGIPMLGCQCSVCQSQEVKNRRLRTSILIKTKKDMHILIDTSVDLRTQFLNNNITRVDMAFITHDHADHCHGIDDLRPLCFGPPATSIPIFTHQQCAKSLALKFPYIFKAHELFNKERPPLGGGIPKLTLHTVDISSKIKYLGEEFEFLLLEHGYTKTLGIIHENFAYIIDCHEISDAQIDRLREKELDLLIIDCVTDQEHKTHLSRDKAFGYIERISPKKAGLIHMNHNLEHEKLLQDAQDHFSFPVFPVFDTQHITY